MEKDLREVQEKLERKKTMRIVTNEHLTRLAGKLSAAEREKEEIEEAGEIAVKNFEAERLTLLSSQVSTEAKCHIMEEAVRDKALKHPEGGE